MSTPWDRAERQYLETARVARLATVDPRGRPHAVPVCFAVDETRIVTPIDEKPKTEDPNALRRVTNIQTTPAVTLIADHYTETWDKLGWVQVRGTATVVSPTASSHRRAVAALRATYDQYADHALEQRPMIAIDPGQVISWGYLSAG
jgi:PPOX class probable F420-dependent enzyme, Rv0121 family